MIETKMLQQAICLKNLSIIIKQLVKCDTFTQVVAKLFHKVIVKLQRRYKIISLQQNCILISHQNLEAYFLKSMTSMTLLGY